MSTDLANTRSLNLLALVLLSIAVCLGIAIARESPAPPGTTGSAGRVPDALAPVSEWQGSPAERYGLGDRRDERGRAEPNGIPDFLDDEAGWRGHLQAAFLYDDLSAGRGVDRSARVSGGLTGRGAVSAADDLVNAYAFETLHHSGGRLLYAAVERIDPSGATVLELEFNQRRFRLSEVGRLEGRREVGDLRIRVVLSPAFVRGDFERWQPSKTSTVPGWVRMARTTAPGCAPGAGCLFVNRGDVTGGGWPSFDASGHRISAIPPGGLIEATVQLDRIGDPRPADSGFASLTITTPGDLALAGFVPVPHRD